MSKITLTYDSCRLVANLNRLLIVFIFRDFDLQYFSRTGMNRLKISGLKEYSLSRWSMMHWLLIRL